MRKAPVRRVATKEEKEHARLLHRSHSLCLLARGSLLDTAACNLGLQVRSPAGAQCCGDMPQSTSQAGRHRLGCIWQGLSRKALSPRGE